MNEPYNREAYLRDAFKARGEYLEMLLGPEDDLVKQYFQADVRAKFDREAAATEIESRASFPSVRDQLMWEDTLDDILIDISHERTSQFAKWGQQDHPDSFSNYPLADYTSHRYMTAAELADRAKENNDADGDRGDVNWQNILLEEVFETLEAAQRARHPDHLRAELVQVAAVAVAWVEAIDRREAE